MSIQSAVSAAMINDDIISVAVMGRREDDRSSLRCNNRRAINATAGNINTGVEATPSGTIGGADVTVAGQRPAEAEVAGIGNHIGRRTGRRAAVILLGGRLLAEGTNLEADMVTMSTFYLQSAQDQNNMFLPLTFDVNTLEEVPDYTAPITSQEGAIIVNTEMLAENNLPMPTCLKDLADPAYAGFVAVTDVQSSSTAWLLMQALVSEYGEEEAQNILHDIYVNAGDHVESSGSAPLQLCEAGEVAVGFGLRHQAVAAKNDGLPIDYVDPTEGNFSLTESVAVLDKGDATNPLAMEMAQCIIENGRAELQQNYPNPLYEGESADNANKSAYPKTFSEPLTFELYEHHIEISEAAKP